MNAQERVSVNARRKHTDDDDDLPKQKQKPKPKPKRIVRPLLPKKPDADNVSLSNRDTKIKKDSSSNSGRYVKIEDVHAVRARSRMRGALTRRVGAC